ncbi:MAG TPA: Wzz/FepE/Etk N-terminal domain-containing protein, partial [Flavobacterium sp.]|nr:Wzz/FepE/Etk N-terminal domain-containing protein [Flavobacterium sp.]
MQNSFINSTEEVDSKINLTEQLFNYLRNWKWFVLSVLIAVSIAYIYLRYQMPQYGLTTTILIKDDKKGTATELDAFSDLGILGVKRSNLENEIELFRSRL